MNNKALAVIAGSILFLSLFTYVAYGQFAPPPPPPPLPTPVPPTVVPNPAPNDPAMQKINSIFVDCMALVQTMYPGALSTDDVFMKAPAPGTNTQANFVQMTQCNQLLNQAVYQYCNDLATYDAAKCTYVKQHSMAMLIDVTAIISEQLEMNILHG
jgi:hypothetical protein